MLMTDALQFWNVILKQIEKNIPIIYSQAH